MKSGRVSQFIKDTLGPPPKQHSIQFLLLTCLLAYIPLQPQPPWCSMHADVPFPQCPWRGRTLHVHLGHPRGTFMGLLKLHFTLRRADSEVRKTHAGSLSTMQVVLYPFHRLSVAHMLSCGAFCKQL